MGIVLLLGCEAEGVWVYVRLRGALHHAVFYDPFSQAMPAVQGLVLCH